MIATNNILTPSSQYSPTAEHQRQAGRRCRRSRGMYWGSSLTKSSSKEKCSAMTRLTAMACLLVVAVYSTTCMSFTMPIQRTQRSLTAFQTDNQQRANTKDTPTSLFVATNGSAEESVSNNNNCEILKVVDDDFDESASLSPSTKNPAFKNTAESPAPPLNFEKYLTMQKKRVPVTIRYSAESGLKPYYLTVAKRVKDLYPDVIIEREEITGEETDYTDSEDGSGTFEVEVDGKMVVATNQRAGTHAGSIFVSMAEMDLAITRARKRRRPTTVYGEDGKLSVSGDIQDDTVSSRLEVLKQKAMELQRKSAMGEE